MSNKCKELGVNSSEYAFSAVYIPTLDTVEFLSRYTEGGIDYICALYFDSKTGSKAKVQIVGLYNGNTVYDARSTITRSTFKTTTKPKFRVVQKSSSKIRSNKKILHDSMIGWAYIANQTGTSLYDFGFHFYGRTLSK